MATQLCENCKRQVPTENYVVHSVHCKRNVQICHLCGDAVLLKEQKEHFEEFHTEINCVQCGQKVKRSEEGHHLANECGKRPVPCRYCEILLPRDRMGEHEEFCGSRTDLCEKCSKYVLIKDLANHVKSCEGETIDPDLPCEFCGMLVATDELAVHQQQCFMEKQGVQIPFLVEDADGIIREFDTTSSESASERRSAGSFDRVEENADAKEGWQDSQREDFNSIVALPCEVCGELCPSDRLMEHQIECNEEIESDAWNASSRGREPVPNRAAFDFSNGDFDFTVGFPHGASNFFEDSFFNQPHERLSPFEMIRRSFFQRL